MGRARALTAAVSSRPHAHSGLVISPVSFQSTLPGVGSAFLGTQTQLNSMYARAVAAGVTSTRIYTTVGASTFANCLTAACSYGGAAKAMLQARAYGMTGASRRGPAALWLAALTFPPAPRARAQSPSASRCPRSSPAR